MAEILMADKVVHIVAEDSNPPITKKKQHKKSPSKKKPSFAGRFELQRKLYDESVGLMLG